jgi:hypothetical protein
MTLRDLLLVVGTLPLLATVGLRLAAEVGLAREAPPAEALTASLAVFGVVFVIYVALTLRAIARATRAILARDAEAAGPGQRTAAVSDFAIHIDRSTEIDLRDEADAAAEAAEPPPAVRSKLLGDVGSLLTRIPSARTR